MSKRRARRTGDWSRAPSTRTSELLQLLELLDDMDFTAVVRDASPHNRRVRKSQYIFVGIHHFTIDIQAVLSGYTLHRESGSPRVMGHNLMSKKLSFTFGNKHFSSFGTLTVRLGGIA